MSCFKGLKALKPDISIAATETRCHGKLVSLRKQTWKKEGKGSRDSILGFLGTFECSFLLHALFKTFFSLKKKKQSNISIKYIRQFSVLYQSSVFETSKISLKRLAAITFSKYEKLSLLF